MKVVARLFALLTIVTVVELFLLLELAQLTSWWVTIATIFVPGLVGAWLLKREGTRAFRDVKAAMMLQREPTTAILDGVIVLVAAALLITPGVLSDLTGLALLIPPVRRRVREYVRKRIRAAVDQRLASGSISFVDLASYAAGADPGYEIIDAEDIPKPR
jgi:UPF0716 protein FxsA